MDNYGCMAEAKLIVQKGVPRIVLRLQQGEDFDNRFQADVGKNRTYVVIFYDDQNLFASVG